MAKEVTKKQVKESKKNIKDKKSFGKEFKAELKKVVWPTPAQLLKSTLAVIVIVIVIVVIVFCLDFVFESMNKYGIDKLKEVVQPAEEQTIDETTNENNNEDNNVENNDTEATTEVETVEEDTNATDTSVEEAQ